MDFIYFNLSGNLFIKWLLVAGFVYILWSLRDYFWRMFGTLTQPARYRYILSSVSTLLRQVTHTHTHTKFHRPRKKVYHSDQTQVHSLAHSPKSSIVYGTVLWHKFLKLRWLHSMNKILFSKQMLINMIDAKQLRFTNLAVRPTTTKNAKTEENYVDDSFVKTTTEKIWLWFWTSFKMNNLEWDLRRETEHDCSSEGECDIELKEYWEKKIKRASFITVMAGTHTHTR